MITYEKRIEKAGESLPFSKEKQDFSQDCKTISMIRFEIVIDKRTRKKSGKYPLKLRVTNYNEVRFISLSVDYTEAQYNEIFRKTPTGILLEHRNSAEKILQKAIKLNQTLNPFDFKKFKELLLKKDEPIQKVSQYISDHFDLVIERKMKRGEIKTAINYRTSKNSLNKFKPGLKISEVTKEFLSNYEDWYIQSHSGFITCTISMYLRSLRAVINELKSKNLLPENYVYPFGKHQYVPPETSNTKTTLKKEEILKIIELNEFNSEEERQARDIWLMLFYCNGVNLKDLVKLRWDNQVGDCFVIRREKTKRTMRVNPQSIKIPITDKLRYLLGILGKRESPYVLGLIKEGATESQIMNRKEKVGKLINKHLDEIGCRLNLSVPLRTKTARDAYATSLKKGDVSIEKIAEMLGQTSTAVTRRYLDSFDQEEVYRINEKLP